MSHTGNLSIDLQEVCISQELTINSFKIMNNNNQCPVAIFLFKIE